MMTASCWANSIRQPPVLHWNQGDMEETLMLDSDTLWIYPQHEMLFGQTHPVKQNLNTFIIFFLISPLPYAHAQTVCGTCQSDRPRSQLTGWSYWIFNNVNKRRISPLPISKHGNSHFSTYIFVAKAPDFRIIPRTTHKPALEEGDVENGRIVIDELEDEHLER